MATRTPFVATALGIYQKTDHDTMPKGAFGFISTTTDQTGITTETDLTGITLTVDVPANRMLKVTAKIPISSATASDRVGINIKEGATVLGTDNTTTTTANLAYTLTAVAIINGPTAGSHTYKVSAAIGGGGSGTGPIKTNHANSGVSFLLVEDVGPSMS